MYIHVDADVDMCNVNAWQCTRARQTRLDPKRTYEPDMWHGHVYRHVHGHLHWTRVLALL